MDRKEYLKEWKNRNRERNKEVLREWINKNRELYRHRNRLKIKKYKEKILGIVLIKEHEKDVATRRMLLMKDLANCRYIEYTENRTKGLISRWSR